MSFPYDAFGAPDLRQGGRLDPVLDMDLKLVECVPEFAVIVSIHNQAEILAETINREPFEAGLGAVGDCFDF